MIPETLQQAIVYFSDEQRCIDFVAGLRWPDGTEICPICSSDKPKYNPNRRVWQCNNVHPKRQFSVKVGTIMEDSPIPLSKWLPAIWLIGSAKNGISSYEIHRALGVTQKTAWFLLHRIRIAMQGGNGGMFGGTVEADETFIGGKARFMHKGRRKATGRGAVGKAVVMGLLERGENGPSKVRAEPVPNNKRKTVQRTIREQVEPGSAVYTDALRSYLGLDDWYKHQFIDHAKEYVAGQVHTNGMENFWALLKRTIKGTYVSVEPFHLSHGRALDLWRINGIKKRMDFHHRAKSPCILPIRALWQWAQRLFHIFWKTYRFMGEIGIGRLGDFAKRQT